MADSARRTLSLDGPGGRKDEQPEPMIEAMGGPVGAISRVESSSPPREPPLTERERTVLRLRFEAT